MGKLLVPYRVKLRSDLVSDTKFRCIGRPHACIYYTVIWGLKSYIQSIPNIWIVFIMITFDPNVILLGNSLEFLCWLHYSWTWDLLKYYQKLVTIHREYKNRFHSPSDPHRMAFIYLGFLVSIDKNGVTLLTAANICQGFELWKAEQAQKSFQDDYCTHAAPRQHHRLNR